MRQNVNFLFSFFGSQKSVVQPLETWTHSRYRIEKPEIVYKAIVVIDCNYTEIWKKLTLNNEIEKMIIHTWPDEDSIITAFFDRR